ncbi:hypothetical protein NDU88_004314 [Pleurodeles waltl]|uniref:Uncharacterized protein n=1 Tax=Pleurodeles waltl TaxID=8319 RepID=A0AAV7M601_PLEWA|nr:hypothetical protein NDU88_004314 [Pleurodeles waltl]
MASSGRLVDQAPRVPMVSSQEITTALEIPVVVAGSRPEPTERANYCVKCHILGQPFFRDPRSGRNRKVASEGVWSGGGAGLKQRRTGGLCDNNDNDGS